MLTNCTGLLRRVSRPSAGATRAPVLARLSRSITSGDEGMATAEYAVGTVAACGFGTVLYQILTSGSITNLLGGLIEKALNLVFG